MTVAATGVLVGPQPQARGLVHGEMGFDEIVAIMRQRRTQDSRLIQEMIEVRDRYNADVVTPIPDVRGKQAITRPGPNFVQETLDGMAQRANMMLPRIICPALDPDSEIERERAQRRRGALYGRWFTAQVESKLYRSYRHLAGYGTCAFVAMPDDERQHANLEIRDPITAYPELRAPDDIRPPRNVGFLFARSVDWVASHYPEAQDFIINAAGRDWDTLWDMVEWIDERNVVVGIMGPRMPAYSYQDSRPYGYTAYELRRWTNKAGVCPVSVPRRVTLDRIIGQVKSILSYSDLYARLVALTLVAGEKAIFPDMAIISKTGMPAQLVGGQWKDGRSGDVNMIIDGAIEVIGKEPSPAIIPLIESTEQAIRGTSGASTLFSGNAGGMGRTGAAIDSLGSASIDPRVRELQTTMELALAGANEGLMAVEEGYYPDSKFTVVLGLRGSDRSVTYRPGVDFRYKANIVSYPMPGADISQLNVALTQLVSTEQISKRTGRQLNPMVDDPELEAQLVNEEVVDSAIRDGFATQVAQGALPVEVAARAKTLMEDDGLDLARAILQAKAELATGGPAPGAPGGPPAALPPGAPGQPGGGQIPPALAQMLASQGAGPQIGPGAQVPAASPDLMNFRHVVQGLNENVSSQAV